MTINKSENKIAKLQRDLMDHDLGDVAIEIATSVSQFTDVLDKFLPATKTLMGRAFFEGDTTIYLLRESLMQRFYENNLRHYESLIKT